MKNQPLIQWFPEFASVIGPGLAATIDQHELDLGRIDCLYAVVSVIGQAQTSNLSSGGDVLEVASAFFKDIQALRSLGDKSIAPTLDILQLMNATQPLVWARSGQQWQKVYDWLYYALNDTMPCPVEVEFSVERLRRMLVGSSPPLYRLLAQDAFMWLDCFYNFAWKVGGIDHLAADLFVEASTASITAWPSADAVAASMQIATWAARLERKVPPPILQRLWDLYKIDGCPELRKELGMLFTGLGSHIGIDGRELAENLLENEGDALLEHERLQLLVNSCAGDVQRIRNIREKLIEEIRRYSNSVSQEASASRPEIYRRERSFDLIAPLLGALVAAGETDVLRSLLCAWKDVPDDHLLQLLYLCPTLPQGPCYAFNGKSACAPVADMDSSLAKLTTAGNSFYQTTVAIRGDPTFRLDIPTQIGVPDTTPPASAKYESAIDDHYGFKAGFGLLEDGPKATGIVVIPWSREPLQTCMLKSCGATLPLGNSFRVPLTDRKLKRALVWHRGTLWGYREAGWLEPRWTSENRPYVDTSKPANGAEPEQEYLYLARGHSGKYFFAYPRAGFILASPGRRIWQRRDATRAPTQRPEWWAVLTAPKGSATLGHRGSLRGTVVVVNALLLRDG